MNLKKRSSRSWLSAALSVGCASVLGLPIWAAEFKSGEKVVIDSDQVVPDDLYVTGDTITVRGRVRGDVVASGRVISIEGTVEGDVIAAGQVVVIRGEVTDDVRIAGMTLKLAEGARVGDDLFAAGFSFESEPGARVAGKTGLTGFQSLLSGEHLQGLEASLVALRIEGRIDGEVAVTVESEAGPAWWVRYLKSPEPLPSVDAGLNLSDGARIEGNLTYKSQGPATIAAGAVVSGESVHEVPAAEPEKRPSFGSRLGKSWRWLIVLFLVGGVLFWLVPEKMIGVAEIFLTRPAASLGWGIVTLLAFPLAMILIAVLTLVLTMGFGVVTLGPAAFLVLVLGLVAEIAMAAKLWIAIFFLAPTVAAFAGGRWLWTRGGKAERSRYSSLLLGLVVFSGLCLIPVLGWILRVLVVLLGLGASALWSVRYLANRDAASEVHQNSTQTNS